MACVAWPGGVRGRRNPLVRIMGRAARIGGLLLLLLLLGLAAEFLALLLLT